MAPAPLIGAETSVGSATAPVNGAALAPAAFTSRMAFCRSTFTVAAAGAPSVWVFVPEARSTPSFTVSAPRKVFWPLSTSVPEPALVIVEPVVPLFARIDAMLRVFVVSSGFTFVPVPPVMIKSSKFAADGEMLNEPSMRDAPPALSCRSPPCVAEPVEVIVRFPPSVRFAPVVMRTEFASTSPVVTVGVFSRKLLAAAPVTVGNAVAELSAAMLVLITGVATKSIAPVGVVMYDPVSMPFDTAVGTAVNWIPVPVPGWKFTAEPTVCAV